MFPGERERRSKPAPPLLNVVTNYSILTEKTALTPASPESLMQTAKEMGYETVALTDRGNFFGMGYSIKAAETQGVRNILGVRLPVGMEHAEAVFLAKNSQGLTQLFELTTMSSRDYKLLTWQDVERVLGDTIVLTNQLPPHAEDLYKNPDLFHMATDAGVEAAKAAAEAQYKGAKVVAAPDTRIASMDHVHVIRFLARMHRHNIPDDAIRSFAMIPPQDLVQLYRHLPGAVDRTFEIAQEAKLTRPKIPEIRARSVPEGVDSHTYLSTLVLETASRLPDYQDIRQRILDELSLIKEFGLTDYLLVCHEIAQYAQEKGISYTVAGSGTHSLILSLLKVTPVDARSLYRQRFISRERRGIPDVDFHFSQDDIAEMTRFLHQRYGEATTLAVVKHLKFGGIQNISRRLHLEVSPAERKALVASELPWTVTEHASGTLFWAGAPQQKLESDTVLAQIDKTAAEDILGMTKIDRLTNMALTRLVRTVRQTEAVLREHGIKVKAPEREDPSQRARILKANTLALPFLETPHGRNTLRRNGEKANLPLQDYVTHVLGLMRPADWYARGVYKRFLETKESPLNQVPAAVRILGRTNYTIIFESQLLEVTAELADMAPETAQRLMRATRGKTGRKEVREIVSVMNQILTVQGWDPEARIDLAEQIKHFEGYSFLEGHARALAKPLCDLAFYAEHYPQFFWSAVYSTAIEKPASLNYKLQAYVNQMLRDGVRFTFPPTNRPETTFRVVDGEIMFSPDLIKDSYTPQLYDQFLRKLKEYRNSPRELVRWQLRNLGTSFTHNPAILIPYDLRFDERRDRQEVIVHQLIPGFVPEGAFRVGRRELGEVTFISFDTGKDLINAALPIALFMRHHNLLKDKFWHIQLTKDGDEWIVSDVFQPANRRLVI